MKKSLTYLIAGLILFCMVGIANSATYSFSVINDGLSTQLAPGSIDDPLYKKIEVGDSFTYNLKTTNNDYWSVNNDFWPLAAMFVMNDGTRTGDLEYSFLLDGTKVLSGNEIAIQSSYVHIGPGVFLNAGMKFDEIALNYSLTASTAGYNELQGRDLNFLNLTTSNPNLSYNTTPTPIPAGIWFLFSGLAGLVGLKRKKTK